jgi:DNA-binding transcriptional LysR family regulator
VDFRRLEVFCRVVELKSFSRAADAVFLSQPTVSEHIRALEESFGEKLLDRLGREVLPTPAGAILYDYARRIIALRNEARQTLEKFRGNLAGKLALGASTIPGAYLLPAAIEAFHLRYPSARINLRISGSTRIVQEVSEGIFELGLVGAPPSEASLERREMQGDELLLALWPEHPLTGRQSVSLEELASEPFILRESGSGTRQAMENALRTAGLDPGRLSLVAEMGSNEAVRECVKGRLGISFLSSLAMREEVERGALATVAVAGLEIRRPFYLIHRKNREFTPLAQAFLEHLDSGEPFFSLREPS